jgi:asparagine synthase (glutamine-hydrolysing)
MKRNLDAPLHSFSISFVGSDKNEAAFARRAAVFIGTEHHELAVSKEMLWDQLELSLWFSELPFVTLAPVGKFLLSQAAKRIVTVVLTGEGADEVFLGYRGFFGRALSDTRQQHSKRSGKSAQLRRLPSGLMQPLSLLIFHKSSRRRLQRARVAVRSNPTGEKPVINLVQEGRIAGMPLDILCFLGDREEMAHSLEARLPFLDHVLYDEAKRIPVDFKMRDGVEKAVLRDAAKGILPDDLRLRRKRGFMLTSDPVDFFGADRKATNKLRDYLSRQAFEQSRLFS